MTWVLKHPNYLPTYHVKEAKSWRECLFLCLCSRLWVERYDGFDAKFRVNWEYFLAGMEVGYYIIAADTFPPICMKCCSSSCQRSFLEFCDGFYRGECAFISPQTHTETSLYLLSYFKGSHLCVFAKMFDWQGGISEVKIFIGCFQEAVTTNFFLAKWPTYNVPRAQVMHT